MAISGPAAAALASLTPSQLTFLHSVPKAELHAHLNGSIPISLLQDLALEYTTTHPTSPHGDAVHNAIERLAEGAELEKINDFFTIFPLIYILTSNARNLKRATAAVLSSFLNGELPQCNYLELRTGPRKTDEMTRGEYMRAVLDEVERYSEDKAALIMSLDRKTGKDTWQECLEIALRLKKEGRRIVGVDLCGDPTVGDVSSFENFFSEARAAGLGITLHIAETIHNTPSETLKLLSYQPNRLGHATFLNDEAVNLALQNKICIEICLSSNLLCKTVTTLESHHIRQYLQHNHPIAICTDDVLPFRTSLLAEYALLIASPPLGLGLSEEEVRVVGGMSMNARFTVR